MVKVCEFSVDGRPIRKVTFNYDGDLAFAASAGGMIYIWRLPDHEVLGNYIGHDGEVSNVVLSRDSKHLMSIGSDGYNNIYDVETGKELYSHRYGKTTSGGIAADKRFFITALPKNSIETLFLFDSTEKPKQIKSIELGSKNRVNGGHWINNDTAVLLYHSDGSITIYNTKTDSLNRVPNCHAKSINDLVVSYDGLMLVTGSSDQTVKLWNIEQDSSISHYETYKYFRSIYTCALSPTHPHIAVAGGTEKVDVTTTSESQVYLEARFTNTFTKKEFANIPGHLGSINSLRYTTDGKGFMSGGENGTVRFYEFDDAFFNADSCVT